ncbi:MAG: hypothetical protein AABM30_11735 [Actinomycetota bacterium]
MNPQDIAAGRFREIRKAEAEIVKTEAALAKATARLEELRGELPQAVGSDRTALAAALVDDKSEPEGKAEAIRAEIVQQELRVEALHDAVSVARQRIPALVKENKVAWRRRGTQELGEARARYENAISELEAAREGLNGAATLLSWLDSGDVCDAANDALGGLRRVESAAERPVIAFSRAIEELRGDCEHLATLADTPRDNREPQPRFELATGGVAGMRVSDWGETD